MSVFIHSCIHCYLTGTKHGMSCWLLCYVFVNVLVKIQLLNHIWQNWRKNQEKTQSEE